MAAVIKALSATTPANDPSELSLQSLAMLIKDEQFTTVLRIGRGLTGHNSAAERIIEPAIPLLEDHPVFEFLSLFYRDRAASMPFWHRLTAKKIPYGLLSMNCIGDIGFTKDKSATHFLYSPDYAACLFADLENLRDITCYHNQAVKSLAHDQHYFLVDVFQQLCPKNPHTAAIRLTRDSTLSKEDVTMFQNEYGEYPVVRNPLLWYYENHGALDAHLENLLAGFEAQPTRDFSQQLVNEYLNRNEPDKAIDVLKKYMVSPDAQKMLNHASASHDIGGILLSQGKIEEAEPYIVAAGRTYSGWGLERLAQYYEITGQFAEAEKVYLAASRNYPEVGPFFWWTFCYATNRPNLRQATNEALQHIVAAQAVTMRVDDNYRRALCVCYCMDLPYLPQLGPDPLFIQFEIASSGLRGLMVWFDHKEKNRPNHAAEMIWRVWGLMFPFAVDREINDVPPQVFPVMIKQVKVLDDYNRLAALIAVDQRTEKPGQFDPAEVEFLIRKTFINDLNVGAAPGTLYLLGRYYAMCGEQEKAVECFRRLLAIPGIFDREIRNYAIKELRKWGFSTEDYIKYSQSDPQIPRFTISDAIADVLCRQHFRVYTESPSQTILARPVAAEPVTPVDEGKTTDWTSGLYKVTSIQFRGSAIPAKETSVCWIVPKDDRTDWSTFGIASVGPLPTQVLPQRSDGIYPLRFGKNDFVHALASFHGSRLILVISLDPDEEPKDIRPVPESSCVRIEMTKLAEVVSAESMISPSPMVEQPIQADHIAAAVPNDDKVPEWINHVRLAAILVTGMPSHSPLYFP